MQHPNNCKLVMKAIKTLHILEHKNIEYKVLLIADGCGYVESTNGYELVGKYNCPSLSATRAKNCLKLFLSKHKIN